MTMLMFYLFEQINDDDDDDVLMTLQDAARIYFYLHMTALCYTLCYKLKCDLSETTVLSYETLSELWA